MFIRKTLVSGTMLRIYLWIVIFYVILELLVDIVATDIIDKVRIAMKGKISLTKRKRLRNL